MGTASGTNIRCRPDHAASLATLVRSQRSVTGFACVPHPLLPAVSPLLGVLTPRDRLIERLQTELLVARQQKAVLYRHVKRPVYNERDRVVLAALSRVLSRERWGAFMVTPATLLAWHRRFVARKWTRPHRPPGGPSLAPDVQALIVKMARENPRWGYQRIKGEMGKLGVHVSATAIAMLLRRKGIGPGPRRGPTWRQFLKAQAAGIIACDFFTVESAFLRSFYVLFFIELSSRRVHITTATRHPDSPWVTQQARNLAMGFHDAGIRCAFSSGIETASSLPLSTRSLRPKASASSERPSGPRTPMPTPSDGSRPFEQSAWTSR